MDKSIELSVLELFYELWTKDVCHSEELQKVNAVFKEQVKKAYNSKMITGNECEALIKMANNRQLLEV